VVLNEDEDVSDVSDDEDDEELTRALLKYAKDKDTGAKNDQDKGLQEEGGTVLKKGMSLEDDKDKGS
jgi:hypothetical protein